LAPVFLKITEKKKNKKKKTKKKTNLENNFMLEETTSLGLGSTIV